MDPERARADAGQPPRGMRPAHDALLAFRFLTRLPVPGAALAGADLGRSCAWFPLPGIVMGLAVAGAARAAATHLSPALLGVLATAAIAAMTGGLHLDGLADVFDGLGGGHGDRERILRIMRDSRIGAFGATALALALAIKSVALADLFARGDPWAPIAALAVARFAAVPLVVLFPSARDDGMGAAFRRAAGLREVAIAAILAAAAVAPLAPRSLLPTAAALAAAGGIALAIRRRLGGLTGDAYGAAIELAEVAYLVAAAMR